MVLAMQSEHRRRYAVVASGQTFGVELTDWYVSNGAGLFEGVLVYQK